MNRTNHHRKQIPKPSRVKKRSDRPFQTRPPGKKFKLRLEPALIPFALRLLWRARRTVIVDEMHEMSAKKVRK